MQEKPRYTALNRYKHPFTFELTGQHFHFIMDNGSEYSMYFLDGENLQLAEKGEMYTWHTYECLKADETTYWVSIDVYDPEHPIQVSPTVNQMPGAKVPNYVMNWIIDTEQRLVTRVIVRFGKIEICPDALSYVVSFGAIKIPGRSLPENRHHVTDRLVGRRINWTYSPFFDVEHIYYEKDHYRLPLHRDLTDRQRMDEQIIRMRGPEIDTKAYPFCEEPCLQIAIKNTLTLFGFSEINLNKASHSGNGGLLVLMDMNRFTDVGRSLSVIFGSNAICAYGEEIKEPDEVESLPSPYTYDRDEFIEFD